MPERILVPGLDELRKALKELGDVEGTKEFKLAGWRAATEVVIPGAQSRASTPLQQAAAATLAAAKVATGGGVRFGAGFPAAMGAEFGAAQNQLRNTQRGPVRGWNQFPPWRGSAGDAGYFLWPTIREEQERIVEVIDESLEPLFARVFPERG